jgi:hypothetical protein
LALPLRKGIWIWKNLITVVPLATIEGAFSDENMLDVL